MIQKLIIQIGDFGMARDLMDDSYYTSATKGGRIPVKWTAPEVRDDIILQSAACMKLRMIPYSRVLPKAC